MNQNRKDQDVPTRGSVLDDRASFEHGSDGSEITRGMGSTGERGHVTKDPTFEKRDTGTSKKKITSLEDLPAPGWKMEER